MGKMQGALISMTVATGVGVVNGLWFFKPYFEEKEKEKFLKDHPEPTPRIDSVKESDGGPPSPSPTTQNATNVSANAAEGAPSISKAEESAPRDSKQHSTSPSGSAWSISSTARLWGSKIPNLEDKAAHASKVGSAQVAPEGIDK